MTVGEHETIAVRPLRIRGIMAEIAVPQYVSDRRERHRSTGMAAVSFLDRIHRKRTDGVDAEDLELFVRLLLCSGPAMSRGRSIGFDHRCRRADTCFFRVR